MALILGNDVLAALGAGLGNGWGTAEFERRFPDEISCARYLEKLRWPKGFMCAINGCRPRKAPWKRGRGVRLICPVCGHETSATAETLWDGLHLDLKVLFLSAFHMARRRPKKKVMGATELQRILKLPHYRAARVLLLRWRLAMLEDMKRSYPDMDWDPASCQPVKVEERFRMVYHQDYEIPSGKEGERGEIRSSRRVFDRLMRHAICYGGRKTEKELRQFFQDWKFQLVDKVAAAGEAAAT